MTYYIISSTVIALLFLIVLYLLQLQIMNTANWAKRFAFALCLAAIFKFAWGYNFYGMEYEDSYVFSNSANELANGIYTHTFLTDGTSIGCINNSLEQSTYGGHFITYPTYLSWFIKLFGFSPNVIQFANFLISLLLLSLLSFFPLSNKHWYIPPILYCIAPIINVFSTSFLSEQFSSFCCLSFLFSFYYWLNNKKSKVLFVSIIICFFVAIICKRENLLLLVVPILFCLLYFIKKDKDFSSILKLSIYTILVVPVYLIFVQNVFNIEMIESADIKQSTFDINFLYKQLPIYLKSLFNVNTFSIVIYTILLLLIINFKNLNSKNIVILILCGCYLLIYPLHYRGYFYIENNMSEFETYRYINNYYYLICIIGGSLSIPKLSQRQIQLGLISITLFSTVQTFVLRKHFSAMEIEDRWLPAKEIITAIREKEHKNTTVLITEQSLLYLNLEPYNFNICDIQCLDKLDYNNSRIAIYIESTDFQYIKERYNVNVDLTKFKPVLYRFGSPILYKYNN